MRVSDDRQGQPAHYVTTGVLPERPYAYLGTHVRLGSEANRPRLEAPHTKLAGVTALIMKTALGMISVLMTVLSVVEAPGVSAAERFIPMDRATVRQVAQDTESQQPARCYRGRLAQSDPTWGSIGGRKGEADCVVLDGTSVVHLTTEGWREVGLPGTAVTCRALKRGLLEAGAPRSVVHDWRVSESCIRRSLPVPRELRRELWAASRQCGEYQQACLPGGSQTATRRFDLARRAILCRGDWGPGRDYGYPIVERTPRTSGDRIPWAILLVKASLNDQSHIDGKPPLRLNGRVTQHTSKRIINWHSQAGTVPPKAEVSDADWGLIQQAVCSSD